jgi:hypothetical protein
MREVSEPNTLFVILYVILYGNPIVAVTDVTEDSRLIEDSTTVSR